MLKDCGRAMRSLLKFMCIFVCDFNKEKNFVILFRDDNEVKGVPDSLNKASRRFLGKKSALLVAQKTTT